ncbi:MAG: hypothetical protein K2X66_10675 [Cyanobacteria bacterium]|nr:hypothetical protein [Cyanobacteriota bacterium]
MKLLMPSFTNVRPTAAKATAQPAQEMKNLPDPGVDVFAKQVQIRFGAEGFQLNPEQTKLVTALDGNPSEISSPEKLQGLFLNAFKTFHELNKGQGFASAVGFSGIAFCEKLAVKMGILPKGLEELEEAAQRDGGESEAFQREMEMTMQKFAAFMQSTLPTLLNYPDADTMSGEMTGIIFKN